MDNENMAHEILFNHEKNEICRKWIDLEIIISSDITQTKKGKYCMYFLISDPRS